MRPAARAGTVARMTAKGEPDPVVAAVAVDAADAALSGNASSSVIQGALARGAMYAGSTGLIALAFAVVLREIGPDAFADLAVAIAVATIAQSVGDLAVSSVAQRLLVAAPASERPALHAQLVGFRFVLMPIAIVLGVLFGVAAGYDGRLVVAIGVLGFSAMLTVIASALVTPLNVELRAGRASLVDFGRQVSVAAGLIVAVALSADLVGYAAVYVAAGAIAVALALLLIGPQWRRAHLPARQTAGVVAKEAAWLGLAIVVNSLFLKVLTVIASLQTTKFEVGLFGAASRVVEVLVGLSLLMAVVAFPVLNRAALDEHRERFANATRRMVEGVLLLMGLAVVVTVTASTFLMRLFAGEKFIDAAPVLEIQAFAVLFAATTQTLIWSLLALRAERLLVVTNLIGLAGIVVLGYALIGPHGAMGGAWAAVGGEVLLLAATLVALRRREPTALPHVGRTLAALALTAAAVAVGQVVPLPEVAAAIVAAAVFTLGALLFRLVPPEVMAAATARLRPR